MSVVHTSLFPDRGSIWCSYNTEEPPYRGRLLALTLAPVPWRGGSKTATGRFCYVLLGFWLTSCHWHNTSIGTFRGNLIYFRKFSLLHISPALKVMWIWLSWLMIESREWLLCHELWFKCLLKNVYLVLQIYMCLTMFSCMI